MIWLNFRDKIDNTCHRTNFSSAKLKTIFDYIFPIMFAVNTANYDTCGIKTSLQNILTPLNVNRYWLFKS